MTAFRKYLLFQVPGWLLAAVLMVWLWPRTGIATWIGVACYAILVAKDFVLYPLLRVGYETGVPTGAQQLVGRIGVVRRDLDPAGTVRIAGELWQARVVEGHPPVPAGSEVRIEGAEGLTLFVSDAKPGPIQFFRSTESRD